MNDDELTVVKSYRKKRSTIENTIRLLTPEYPDLVQKLEQALASKPAKGTSSDVFEVSLSRQELEGIVYSLGWIESDAVPIKPGLSAQEMQKGNAKANYIAAVLDEWNKELFD